MAIDLFGHCAHTIAETQVLIAKARAEHPDWFDGPVLIDDAKPLGPFGAEIAEEFGLKAKCRFGIFLHDKTRSELLTPVARYLYASFGEGKLVITHGMDSVWRP